MVEKERPRVLACLIAARPARSTVWETSHTATTDLWDKTVNHSINVTPLCDVMLVLIIFMVVTPLIDINGGDAQIPAGRYPSPRPSGERVMRVLLDRHGQLHVNDVAIPREELTPKLTEHVGNGSGQEIYLRADEQIPYARVLEVSASAASRALALLDNSPARAPVVASSAVKRGALPPVRPSSRRVARYRLGTGIGLRSSSIATKMNCASVTLTRCS